MLPSQCYTGDNLVGPLADVQSCLKELQDSSDSLLLPPAPSSGIIINYESVCTRKNAATGKTFQVAVVGNSTCKFTVSKKQVAESLKRIINSCNNKVKNNWVGGREYLDGNDQLFVFAGNTF